MLYNTEVFGGGPALAEIVQDDVVYNGFGLQNDFFLTSDYSENNLIDFDNFDQPLQNGRGFLSYYKRGKRIGYNITIKGDTPEEFNNNLDNLRRAIFQPNKNLDIKINGITRRIKASCISNPKQFRHYNLNFLKTTIEFETLEPFFYEIGYQSTNFLDKTTSFVEEIGNQGSDVADLLFIFIFKTASVTKTEIELGENTITVEESIDDGDVLVIDGENKTVKLNDVEVDYLGSFPILGTGINLINFDITGTFDVDISCLNKIYYV